MCLFSCPSILPPDTTSLLTAMPLFGLGYTDSFFHLLQTVSAILLPFPPQQLVSAPTVTPCTGPPLPAKPAGMPAPCINKTSLFKEAQHHLLAFFWSLWHLAAMKGAFTTFLPPILKEKRFPLCDLQHSGTRSLANPQILPHTRAHTHANTRAVPLNSHPRLAVIPLCTSFRACRRGLSLSPPTSLLLPVAALVAGSPLILPACPDSYCPTFPRIAGMGFPVTLDEYWYFLHDSITSGKYLSF